MSFQITFNATQVAPSTGGTPVHEAGTYDVVLVGSNEKPVKDKPGASFALMEMQVIVGPIKGSKINDRLNLKNPSQQAVDIAYGQLSAYCYVTGVIHIQQSLAELHGKPFKVEISKVERDDRPGTFRNEVIRVLDAQGREPGSTQPAAGVQQVQQVQQPMVQQQPAAFNPPQTMAQPAFNPAPAQPSFTPQQAQAEQPQQPAGGNATPTWAQ